MNKISLKLLLSKIKDDFQITKSLSVAVVQKFFFNSSWKLSTVQYQCFKNNQNNKY